MNNLHAWTILALMLPALSYASNDNAIAMYTLLSVQSEGGQVQEAYNMMSPYAEKGVFTFDYNSKILFLALSGMNEAIANDAILTILPALQKEEKSIHEQVTALLIMSGKFCDKVTLTQCQDTKELFLPMMTLESQRGCGYNDMEYFPGIGRSDVCLCENQDDVLLMMDLVNKMDTSSSKTNHTDDASLLAMMMLNNQLTCTGTLVRNSNIACSCNHITMGEDAFLMNRILSDQRIQKAVDEENFDKALDLARKPHTRVLDLQSALVGSLGGTVDPSILAAVSNGGSTTSLFKNILLANMGLDPATTYLFLNGGFSDSSDKTAMINYFANMGFFPPDIIPFMLGVDDGFTFYINSLLTAGAIDPILGLLMLSTKSTVNQKDVLEFIIDYILKGMNPEYLAHLGKPYIPKLPYGIYPGSELYFVHFESLNINTCSLHALENRFDCGYVGINAAACEIKPYCCYNPIFLSDLKVREATQNKITTALDIPWCYFNIFFIYYDQFYLNVLRPGEFPSEASCKGLYKYDLDLDPTLYLLSSGGSNSLLSQLTYGREECGFPGVSEFHCVAIRGCCWDKYAPNQVPQCYKPNGPSTLEFNLNTIPTAYLPMNGTCSTNYYQSPILYFRRIACHYTIEYAKFGFNILEPPSQKDCLWNLGCCWEDNVEVLKKYPNTPQCYQREDGGYNVRPGNIPVVSDLLQRSGLVEEEKDEKEVKINENHIAMRRTFAAKGFPPAEQPEDKNKDAKWEELLANIEDKPLEEVDNIIKQLFANL